MNIDLERVEVVDNKVEQRYEAAVNGELAVVEYHREGDRIVFTHTGVPTALEGHGLAARLAQTVLNDARARHLMVVPRCPYITSYIKRHQQYLDLVVPQYHARAQRKG
ncbi:MAG TPA: GNAT family N-acetyltransferase [Ktedonobacterales bacterium]|nr:GNAT family N-acetyltransferase [Ktedonobacterales bacterium]